MTIEVSTGIIIGAAITYLTPTIGFIIWVKTEVSLLKQAIAYIKENKGLEDKFQEQSNKDIKAGIQQLTTQFTTFQAEATRQLFDLNTKITKAQTLAEADNPKK